MALRRRHLEHWPMRSHGSKLLFTLLFLTLAVSNCRTTKSPVTALPNSSIRPLTNIRFEPTSARLERGRYLTEGVLQCFVCHTDRDWTKPGAPPIEEMKGAGHNWNEDTPGLVAPNITPDKETGAGNWTDDMFARAIREGVSHDGRPLDAQMFSANYRDRKSTRLNSSHTDISRM